MCTEGLEGTVLVLIFVRLSLPLTNWLLMDPCRRKQSYGAAWHFHGSWSTLAERTSLKISAWNLLCLQPAPPHNLGREFDVTSAVFVLEGLKLALS